MREEIPLISVIIPCYNVEAYIEECLKSIYSQTYKCFEVICIDNNSTDNTYKVLVNLKSNYPDLILKKEKRPGAPIARNKGLSIAKGEIVQYLDADDIIEPRKFERQVVAFKDSEIDIVVSDRIIKNESLTLEIERLTFEKIEIDPVNTALSEIIITGNPLYRKLALQKIGGFDESLNSAQDWDLNLRLIFRGAKIKYIPGFYFVTRRLNTSLSSDWIKVSKQAADLLVSYKPTLVKCNLTEASLSRICFTFYESMLYTKDTKRSLVYYKDLLFWAKRCNYSFLNIYKRFIARTFGLRLVLHIDLVKVKLKNSGN